MVPESCLIISIKPFQATSNCLMQVAAGAILCHIYSPITLHRQSRICTTILCNQVTTISSEQPWPCTSGLLMSPNTGNSVQGQEVRLWLGQQIKAGKGTVAVTAVLSISYSPSRMRKVTVNIATFLEFLLFCQFNIFTLLLYSGCSLMIFLASNVRLPVSCF